LLLATLAVDKLTDGNADIQAGIKIIRRALEAPVRQISANAGVEGSIVVGKVLDAKGKLGFDAQNEVYCDLIAAGIVDPAKVVTTALRDAASVAGLLITTEAMVADQPAPAGAAPAMPDMSGMGGMGGMM
jgi:chaperonin GroEL